MPLELYNKTKKSIQKLPFQLENNKSVAMHMKIHIIS